MKLGLQVAEFNWPGTPGNTGARLAEIGRAADDAGFASLWVMDHFFQMDMPQMGLKPEEPMFDGYSALAYVAAVTNNVRLGTLVTGVNYRHPGHLIKIVTGLDVLSGGRAWLGIGAGWYEREARGLGFPFPPLAERFERLEETLQLAHQMWRDDVTPFAGKHYHLAEPMNHPQPLSKPHPPILIGGSGEKKTLRLVAQYADACNLFAYAGPEELQRKLDVLKGHCDAVGRDYDEIERTVLTTVNLGPGGMAPSDFVQQCRVWAAIGIQHVIFNMPNTHEIIPIETIGRAVLPEVAEL
jgi:F420-dependent oxidoreductase-like protein